MRRGSKISPGRQTALLEDEAELSARLSVAGWLSCHRVPRTGRTNRVDLLEDGLDDHREVGRRVLGEDPEERALVGVDDADG